MKMRKLIICVTITLLYLTRTAYSYVPPCLLSPGGCLPVCTIECRNGGTCLYTDTCRCPDGFSQPICNDEDECKLGTSGCSQRCYNTPGSYTCGCDTGYKLMANQRDCEDEDECKLGTSGCSQRCYNTPGSYTCGCDTGYKLMANQRDCEAVCSTACRNGGICAAPDTCSCPDGFVKPYCDDENECEAGTSECSQICHNTYGSYTCSCNAGYQLMANQRGCQDANECRSNNGGCSDICDNTYGTYNCRCNDGYELHIDGHTCKDLNECAVNVNRCTYTANTVCNNTPGSYTCDCLQGFERAANQESCKDINECSNNIGGCSNICENTPGAYSCKCQSGFTLDDDKHTCLDVNECSTNNGGCSDICDNTYGTYTCRCNDGYVLRTDGQTCKEIDVCDTVGCSYMCAVTTDSYICICQTGFTLDYSGHTCSDTDECITENGGCGQECTNIEGSYECFCNAGFELDSDQHLCNDVNECVVNVNSCAYTANTVCNNTPGSYTCDCLQGFERAANQESCKDINECSNNIGGCSDICENTPGAYSCKCQSGFTLDDDKHTCLDDNECSTNNGGCSDICDNTYGTYNCRCNDGYVLGSDWHTCRDTDECITENGGCGQECTNTQGSYECSCNGGFELDSDQHLCYDVNECAVNVNSCAYTANTVCNNTPGSYTCDCLQGFERAANQETCKDINECGNNIGGCSDICENTPGAYSCKCQSGFTLDDDKHTCLDTDECITENGGCGQECTNMQGSYECSCNDGFELDSDQHLCNDIDECVVTYKAGCQDICTNIPGSFECTCHDGSPTNSDGKTSEGSTEITDVFHKYNINGKQLPRGCSTLQLQVFAHAQVPNFNVLLSSTSPWYQHSSARDVLYTYGIVFVETGGLALPVSLSGITVADGSYSVGLPKYTASEGILYSVNDRQGTDCLTVEFTVDDITEFTQANSFLITYFKNIGITFPDWLSFGFIDNGLTSLARGKRSIFQISNIQSLLSTGSQIDHIPQCRGAPVKSSILYHVILFGEDFQLSVYGSQITLPTPTNGETVCIIIDLYQDSGTTFFVMLPETLRNVLSKLQLFQALTKDRNIELLIRGFAVSLNSNIDVHYHTNAVTFWNGDSLFDYPVSDNFNLWVGADYRVSTGILELQGSADMFIGVPSIQNILIATFEERWDILFALTGTTDLRLKFKLFGQTFVFEIPKIAALEMESYASIGGLQDRSVCGPEANPSGLFLSLKFKVNPFSSVPILRDLIFNAQVEGYLFVVKEVDTTLSVLGGDISPILSEIHSMIHNLITMTEEFLNSQINMLTSHTINLVNKLTRKLNTDLLNHLQTLINIHSIGNTDWSAVLDAFKEFWSNSWIEAKKLIKDVLDSVEFNVKLYFNDITLTFESHVVSIEQKVKEYVERITSRYTDSFTTPDGFGIQAYVDIDIFSLKIPHVMIEFVYSIDSLGECSKYKDVYKIFEGRKAARFFGVIRMNSRLGRFLRIRKEYGLGAAFSVDTRGLFLVQINVKVTFLGLVSVSRDLFISNDGISMIFEARIWNHFLAHLTVSAELHKSWYDLTFRVIGKLLANSGNGDSFKDSYLSAIRKLLNDIGASANKRLTAAQLGLTKAQNTVSKAQDWLEKKKAKLDDANRHFDNAIATLEGAKRKLEAAKEPFRNALAYLREKQRDIDRLCRIRSCRSICIPGLRLGWCRGWWGIRYPCFTWTNCMFKVPDLICIARNAFCTFVRRIAYVALEIARIFVRTAMLAFDVAKAALTAAQFVVDKSRVVLAVAKVLFSVAQIGLDAVKGVLEVAKLALEGVKIAVNIVIQVFDYVIRHGLQKLIDIKNRQFKVEIKTKDIPVLLASCDIKVLGSPWVTVPVFVNFRRLLQSLWQAAKTIVRNIISTFGRLLGRRKREIEYATKSFAYKILRQTRDADINVENLNSTVNETMGGSYNNFKNDYDYRVLIFAEKCAQFNNIFAFLNESMQTLLELTNDTAKTLHENGTMTDDKVINTDELANNMTLGNMGIDLDVAIKEYNITSEDLEAVLSNFTTDYAGDPTIQEIASLSNTSQELHKEQIEFIDHSNILEIWIQDMENLTTQNFDNTTCVSFIDCVHHSVATLYDIFYGEDSVDTASLYRSISEIETLYLELFDNETSLVVDMNDAAGRIVPEMNAIDEVCPFCSTAPTLLSPFVNVSVPYGENAYFICDVTGDPEPTFWWFSHEELMENETDRILKVRNVTETDGPYYCIAGNVVANLTTPDLFVNVKDDVHHSSGQDSSDVNLVYILAPVLSVAVLAIVVLVIVVRVKLFSDGRMENVLPGFGSRRSLNSIRPHPESIIPSKSPQSLGYPMFTFSRFAAPYPTDDGETKDYLRSSNANFNVKHVDEL